ncbi:MAG: hypothetical protein ED557_06515 [Balneola sp.]|nr:MAG: hypothetical protein ED557_06515 [Balneola sp.]
MKFKKLAYILLFPALLVGCDSLFDKGDVENTYDGPDQVGFFPLQDSNNLGCNVTSTTIQVQLISSDGTASSDVSVNFSAAGGSTASAGTDYSFGTTSPVTISAGETTADIDIDFVVTTVGSITQPSYDGTTTDTLRTAGTYSGVTAGGSGTGATFDVVVDTTGAAAVTIASGGTGYACTDSFTITDANLGGGGAPDLTFDVADLTGSFAASEVLLLLQLDGSSATVAANLDSTNVFMAQ